MRRSAVLICPGRGTYGAPELGYITRHHGHDLALLDKFDARRAALGQPSLRALDSAAQFSPELHTRGDNASALIFAASLLDARVVSDEFDIVAVTGNSMGWYTALAAAEAVTPETGFEIANTMGMLMQLHMIGGQSLFYVVDDTWRDIPGLRASLLSIMQDINTCPDHQLELSINLGGMLLVAGNEAGLAAFDAEAQAVTGTKPMRLNNHAAFHTSLQAPVAAEGRSKLAQDLFGNATRPLIDGQGRVWWPGAYDLRALREYTLRTQVEESYDFTAAITAAARNFAPDVFILTGPGANLGGAVAQSLISIDWHGLADKQAFQARQAEGPILLSMGREDQRMSVVSEAV